jgi:hypothetical protein
MQILPRARWGLRLAAVLGLSVACYLIWCEPTASEVEELTPPARLEAVIQANHYPDAVSSRLRLLRDMPGNLDMRAVRLYLQLPEEPDGGFDDGRINTSSWDIGDGYQVEITSDLDSTAANMPDRVVLVTIRHTPSSDPTARHPDVLTPRWTAKGLKFE